MNFSELIDATRTRLQDRAKPYLWDDEELALYLNEAESEAAERGQLLLDFSTPDVVEIRVIAGQRTYALHPSIIRIQRAKLDAGTHPLVETSAEKLDDGASDWDILQGQPDRYIPNADNSITLVRIPVEDDVLRLRVTRLPLKAMKDEKDCPEIAERYHFRMLDWALHLAYLKQDPETLDEKKAERHDGLFTASFGERPDANVQRKRRDGRTHAVRMGTW